VGRPEVPTEVEVVVVLVVQVPVDSVRAPGAWKVVAAASVLAALSLSGKVRPLPSPMVLSPEASFRAGLWAILTV
jgi:hypothetical protein